MTRLHTTLLRSKLRNSAWLRAVLVWGMLATLALLAARFATRWAWQEAIADSTVGTRLMAAASSATLGGPRSVASNQPAPGDAFPSEHAGGAMSHKAAQASPVEADAAVASAHELQSAIQKTSANERAVDAAQLQRALRGRNPIRTMKIVPEAREGRTVGMKLYGVNKGGAVHHLGFESGDVLRAINGIPLTGEAKMLASYKQLQLAERITVELERR